MLTALVLGLLIDSHGADVVIYGATPGGIACAIQVRRMGKTALLVEPTSHVGGLTTSGLGATDSGEKGVIGGISREFYRRLRKHYEDSAAWNLEKRDTSPVWRVGLNEDAQWTFEPKVAERVLDAWLAETGVEVLKGDALAEDPRAVTKDSRDATGFGQSFGWQSFCRCKLRGGLASAGRRSLPIGAGIQHLA